MSEKNLRKSDSVETSNHQKITHQFEHDNCTDLYSFNTNVNNNYSTQNNSIFSLSILGYNCLIFSSYNQYCLE